MIHLNLIPAALIEYFLTETSESQFLGNDSILNDPATQYKKTATKKTIANMMMAKKWLWKTLQESERGGSQSEGQGQCFFPETLRHDPRQQTLTQKCI